MVFRLVIWGAVWGILSVPALLLCLGGCSSNRVPYDVGQDEDRREMEGFARGFGWMAATMPGCLTVFTTLFPKMLMGSLGPYFWCFCIVASFLCAIASTVLFVLYARRWERITGPLAGLIAAMLSIFLVAAGRATA